MFDWQRSEVPLTLIKKQDYFLKFVGLEFLKVRHEFLFFYFFGKLHSMIVINLKHLLDHIYTYIHI